MIDDEISGQYLIRQEEIIGITLHPYVIHDNPIHFMLSKKTVTIENMHAINSAIINVQAEIEKIIASYTLKL